MNLNLRAATSSVPEDSFYSCLYRTIRHHIVPEFLTEKYSDILLDTIWSLPVFTDAVFECHLGDCNYRVDFSVLYNKAFSPKPEHIKNHESWSRLYFIQNRLLDDNSELEKYFKEIWLEFDSDGHEEREGSSIPIPCVLLGFQNSLNLRSLVDLTAYILNLPAERVLDNIDTSLGTMPSGVSLQGVGRMFSRNNDLLRMVFNQIPICQVSTILKQNNSQVSYSFLDACLLQLSNFQDYIALSVDMNGQNSMATRIGIECYFENTNGCDLKWCSFLNFLVAENLCTTHQATALNQWPKIPEHDDLSSKFLRFNTHIKIVIDDDCSLQAKAYLGLQSRQSQMNKDTIISF